MSKSILILGGGSSQMPLILEAKKLGYNVTVVDKNKNAPAIRYSDQFIKCSTYEPDSILSELQKYDSSIKPCIIIARSSDETLLTQAALSEHLGLMNLSSKYAEFAIDKEKLKKICKRKRINYIANVHEDHLTCDEFYPIIIKPNKPKIGKVNVVKINNFGELKQNQPLVKDGSFDHKAIIEKYIEGIDVSAFVKCINTSSEILVVFDELILEKNNRFYGKGYLYPSRIMGSKIYKQIEESINKYLEDWNSGIETILFSFKVSNESIYLYEINYGLGGDGFAEKFLPNLKKDFNSFIFYIKLLTEHKEDTSFSKIKSTLLFENKIYKNKVLEKLNNLIR